MWSNANFVVFDCLNAKLLCTFDDMCCYMHGSYALSMILVVRCVGFYTLSMIFVIICMVLTLSMISVVICMGVMHFR